MVDSNTLLQADATVIAGVLVLLTIYSLKPIITPYLMSQEERLKAMTIDLEADPSIENLKKKATDNLEKLDQMLVDEKVRKNLAFVIIISLVPFSSSAFFDLLSIEASLEIAKILASIGFIYLVIAVATIVMIPFVTRTTRRI